MRKHEWLQCRDCGWVWDDLNPHHEICDCFDRIGRRRSFRSFRLFAVPMVTVRTDATNASQTEPR